MYESHEDFSHLSMVSNAQLKFMLVPNNIRFALQDTSIPRGGGPNGDKPVGVPKDTGVGKFRCPLQSSKENPHALTVV